MSLGKYLLSASDDDSVSIYDCESGEQRKLLYSKKYGVDNMKFVHSGQISAICSSRNEFDCTSNCTFVLMFIYSFTTILGFVRKQVYSFF